MSKPQPIKILIADDDNQLSRRLADYINDRGFQARIVTSGKEARAEIQAWRPRFVIADLMLPEGNALSLIDFVKAEAGNKTPFTSVIVMSGHNVEANVRMAFNRGAKDYIAKPFRHDDVLKRLVFHSRGYRHLMDVPKKDFSKLDESSLMLHLTDLVLRQALAKEPLQDTLFKLTRMLAMRVDGVRCNIVHVVNQNLGYVVVSSDDPNACGIQLDLYKYPEILHVVNTQSLIAIENLEENQELRSIREHLKNVAFNSMVVCPVSRDGVPFGVLSMRMPPQKVSVSDNEIRFVEIVSHIVSLVIGNEIHKENGDFWVTGTANPPLPFPPRKLKNS